MSVRGQRIAIYLLVVLMVFAYIPFCGTGIAKAETGLKVSWTGGGGDYTISDDRSTIDVTPKKDGDGRNGEVGFVTANVHVDFEAADTFEDGAVKVTLPYGLFKDREGNLLTGDLYTPEVALPEAPATSSSVDFNYTFDPDSNSIIIQNYKTSGLRSLDFTVTWKYQPTKIENDSEHALHATLTENGNQVATDDLTANVHTSAKISSASKAKSQKYVRWQSAWGEAPADADDYVYFVYKLSCKADNNYTQPFKYQIEENPQNDGKIVAFTTNAGILDQDCKDTDSSLQWKTGDATDLSNQEYEETYRGVNGNAFATVTKYFFVVTAYPKDKVNDGDTLENKVTMSVVGVDGGKSSLDRSTRDQYQNVNFNYNGDYNSVSKWVDDRDTGVGLALMMLQHDKSGYLGRFQIGATATDYSLTQVDGEYGKQSYTASLIDGQLYLEGELLEPGDFSFTNVRFENRQKDVISNEDTGDTKVETLLKDNIAAAKVYYRTSRDGEWVYLAETMTNASYSDRKTVELNTQSSLYGGAKIPSDAYELKVETEGAAYSNSFVGYVGIILHPTDHVKKLIEGKSSISVINIDALSVLDHDKTKVASEVSESTVTGNLKDQIIAEDKNSALPLSPGMVLPHQRAEIIAETVNLKHSMRKDVRPGTSDKANKEEIVPYELKKETSGYLYTDDPEGTLKVLHDENVNIDNKKVVFYDLLPEGMYIDQSEQDAVTAKYQGKSAASEYNVPSAQLDADCVEYELIKDWKNSGRTMLKATVTVPESLRNGTNANVNAYFVNKAKGYISISNAVILSIKTHYSWEDMELYGTTVNNEVASYAENSYTGYPDDPTDSTNITADDKDLFTDLDNDGNKDAQKDTYYANTSKSFILASASQSGFKKEVQASTDNTYSDETTEIVGGMYHYRLKIRPDAGVSMRNLVMYDNLEDAYGDNKYWKGTFDHVETGQAEKLGIKPVVYYSTQKNLDLRNNADQTDLTNTDIWSTDVPADKADVTAIAFDYRKATDGTDFELTEKQTASALIYMNAPEDATDLKGVKAYNRPLLQTQTRASGGSVWSDTTVKYGNTVKVNLDDPYGNLVVKKVVSGYNAASEADKTFTITVTLSDTTINGTYGDMTFKDGVATVSLKGGESATAKKLPKDITYTVTETAPTGYTASFENATGTIVEQETKTATVTNTLNKYGDLKVTKTVKDAPEGSDQSFDFTVTLKDTTINGKYGDMTFKDGVATVTLKDGESATAKNLPKDLEYEVTEADCIAEGYVSESTGTTGTIPVNDTATAAFTNTYKVGALSLTKKIVGAMADPNKDFAFKITLSGSQTVNGTFSDVTFENNVATITLKGGETKTINNLPVDYEYKVEELNGDGYKIQSENETGTIVEGATATVSFTNTKSDNPPIDKKVNGEEHAYLQEDFEPFRYDITTTIPKNAKSFVVSDTLVKELEFVDISKISVKAGMTELNVPGSSLTLEIKGNSLTVTLPQEMITAYGGQPLQVSFLAKIREGADLMKYVKNEEFWIPNTAKYEIDHHFVTETEPVYVTPPNEDHKFGDPKKPDNPPSQQEKKPHDPEKDVPKKVTTEKKTHKKVVTKTSDPRSGIGALAMLLSAGVAVGMLRRRRG